MDEMPLIQKRIEMLESLQNDVKTAKEMLRAELDNDTAYREIADEAKTTVTKRKKLKDDIINSGSNQKIVQDIRANLEEIATIKQILSAELIRFYEQHQTDEVPAADGQTRKFVVSVKLLPRGARRKFGS